MTSPTSAALRDVLHVLSRRYRQSRVIIYPTPTQGAAAAPGIVAAIGRANRRQEVDVLLLVRGGGSLEDLWAFNEIAVAGAIRDSTLPIVAGIGHEVDVTISDLVADLRAPTPSAAAELATPDTSSLQQRLVGATRQLAQLQRAQMQRLTQRLQQQHARLQLRHPERKLREQAQRVDELGLRLQRAWQQHARQRQHRADRLDARLRAASPAMTLQRQRSLWQALHQRLEVVMALQHNRARTRFELLARSLHSVSPLAVLDRGYALIKKDDVIIRNAGSVTPGDEVTARLASGEIVAVVSATRLSGNILPNSTNSEK